MLEFFTGLPPLLIYVLLGVGAALETVVPPVPADAFVLLGGFLADRGGPDALVVFLVTWGANVASALAVYWVGLRYGARFFERGAGRRLLNPEQMEHMRAFYARWGLPAIFCARFLPGLRAVAPASAGASHMIWWKVAPPIAVASAIWHGALVWLGKSAGNNLERIRELMDRVNLVLLAVALLVFSAVGLWWWRTRRKRRPPPT